MMTTHEICEVLRAIEQEQPVQRSHFNKPNTWFDSSVSTSEVCYAIGCGDTFRVKPVPRKPRERWQNVYLGEETGYSRLWCSKEAAYQARDICKTFVECVHYQEVVEE